MKITKPVIVVIFGATGDLNWRKITPALYNLFLAKRLPEKYAIIGTGRTEYTNESFQDKLLDGVKQFSRKGEPDSSSWNEFATNISYYPGQIKGEKTYNEIKSKIDECKSKWNEEPIVMYYLAVSPKLFADIAINLNTYGLTEKGGNSRIVIEKPFGRDLASAQYLNETLYTCYEENQLYRIDHYLGKETVQNLVAFRFGNSIFEPLWNRNHIQNVQITVSEKLGVGNRSSYYETAGALRDMVQNHVFQLLCLIGMEPPVSFEADEIRNKKVDVLKSVRPFDKSELKKNAVRGQYESGWMKGEEVPAYREEEGVDPNSMVETFAALKLQIDNWRWKGVPFYIRSGKRMHEKISIIAIQFKDVPHMVFPDEALDNWRQNRLIISIQPEMSIRLQVQAKRPGLEMILNTVDMTFNYDGTFKTEAPEAYENLLLEVMEGDQTLFMRADQIEKAWEILMPVINSWESKPSLDFPNYAPDSWGPELAESLIAKDGFHWFTNDKK